MKKYLVVIANPDTEDGTVSKKIWYNTKKEAVAFIDGYNEALCSIEPEAIVNYVEIDTDEMK